MEYSYWIGYALPHHNIKVGVGELLMGFFAVLLIVKVLESYFERKRESSKSYLHSEEFKAYHLLPGPRPFPIRFIGNALQLPARRDLHKKMVELYKDYGPCYRITLLNEDIVCLNTAPLAQAVLGSTDLNHFRKGEQYDIYFSGTQGLPMLSGEKWKTRRKMLSTSFSYGAFQRYNPSFNKHTEKLVQDLGELFKDGKVHTMNDAVKDCIFKQSSEAIMGVDISDSKEGSLFCKSLETYLHIVAERLCKPWLLINWIWRLHPLSRKQHKVFLNLVNVTTKVIDGFKREITEASSPDTNDHGPKKANNEYESMIEIMLKNGVPDREIFEEVAVTLAVAHDTTSVAIQLALFMLAINPHHQELCRAEADAVFNDPSNYSDGNLNFSALPELKHLERCILESQRMLALSSILMRKLDAPLKLQEGLTIPAGVSIYIFPPVIHLNPEYFPNPETFDPDRYLPENSRTRHPYAYLPFAAGPRNCLGTKLALIEAKMVISKILRKFLVTSPDKFEDVVIVPSVIPTPEKPVNFCLRRRD